MELRHLRYFVAVAEAEHMGRAAATLRVAQSALSRQLQDLEREVGAPLLARHPRGVRLTPAGTVFLDGARATLAHADRAVEEARAAAAGDGGRLRVAPPDFGVRAALVGAMLATFRERHPQARIELVPLPWIEHVDALLQDRIDVGFAVGASSADYPDALVAEAIVDEPLAWALLPASHPLAERPSLSLADVVTALPMVLSERAAIPVLHDRITDALARRGFVPRIVSAPPAWPAVVQLVAAGAGWCLVVAAGADPAPPGTVARPLGELADEVAMQLHLLRRRDAGPLAERFADAMRDQARDAPAARRPRPGE